MIDINIANKLRLNKNVVFLDCRFQLSNPAYGFNEYQKSHIPLSRYVDLNKDLSSSVQKHGGRHPLPNLNDFGKLLGELGIDHDTIVICYDDGTNDNAARCWFLCNLVGHKFTFVLNGGYKKWLENGFEVTTNVEEVLPKNFEINVQDHLISSMHEVKRNSNREAFNLIDSRENIRYIGEFEPIDRIAGHIPGAKNSFWKDVLTESGEFKTTEELQALFSPYNKGDETVVYCGSGVTGCVNYLGLIEAGYTNVKLYPGSFSDWISYEDNVVNKIKL
ncbi:sulfurtransferase [Bacillus sp. AFS041924]|uniref:sulfurtransferase n=1 Tax=Bacillus sp. AFS041924 TaxID=2033503 RepID=UPI000BFE93B2|nr:sulfurtransferase [Bacillus sp. AFS041924]